METNAPVFSDAADKLIAAWQDDPVSALCALSTVQRAFEAETRELDRRIARLAGKTAEQARARGLRVPGKTLPLLWLLLTGFSSVAFALGYWLARHSR